MPGRTENNVKNRFNMMYKNIKDHFIKNRNHQSVFVMQEKVDQDAQVVEDHIDEEKLIMQLIEKKKKELEERKNTPVPENNTASVSNIDQSDAKMQESNYQNRSVSQTRGRDLSESMSNTNLNETSRQLSIKDDKSNMTNPTNQTSKWVKQKEYLTFNNICQNKEKINHAIEKLIEACPNQLNIIKRLVEYI